MLEDLFEQLSQPDHGYFVVEGRWCVEALLACSRVETIAVVRADGSHQDLDSNSMVYVVPKSKLSELMGFDFHRGVVALAKRPVAIEPKNVQGLWIACPELADESNLGAIVRTAAALGIQGVLVPDNKGANIYSRKSIRTSSGAVFRIPIFECGDLEAQIISRKEKGITVFATALGDACIKLNEAPGFDNGIVLFGPEKGGLSDSWLDLCDVKLEIPMANNIDSLNVAACAAIVLYQLATGRRT